MEKLIGRILNYIARETVEVGKTTMLRSEPLQKYILELYEHERKWTPIEIIPDKGGE